MPFMIYIYMIYMYVMYIYIYIYIIGYILYRIYIYRIYIYASSGVQERPFGQRTTPGRGSTVLYHVHHCNSSNGFVDFHYLSL